MTTEHDRLAAQLRAGLRGEVRAGHPLAAHTHYRIGGPADLALFPADAQDLARAVELLDAAGLPRVVLGGGCNVLVSDRGVRGAVVLTEALRQVRVEDGALTAGAGARSHDVALAALDAGLTGAEFLAHLPGSIGGACFMNARAYGGEISQVLRRAAVVDPAIGLSEVQLDASQFAYKRSPFQTSGAIVAEAVLQLADGDRRQIEDRMTHIERERRARHELDHPSCGCVFQNDHAIGVPSGQLIESCGLKGYRVGDAQVSLHHANFVFNLGAATARDVHTVIEHVRRTVAERTGHHLELEVQLVGDWDE
jgi:UDP-N-acetylmuramate dehydrogenase